MKVTFGKIDFRYEKIYCVNASCQSLLCNYSHVLIIIYRVQPRLCRAHGDNYRRIAIILLKILDFSSESSINHIKVATATHGFIDVSIFLRVRRDRKRQETMNRRDEQTKMR